MLAFTISTKHRPSITNQLGLIFGICAPVLVSAMLTVQMSLVSYMGKYYTPLEQAVRESQINIWRAVDSVQLGLDVAWDMFILPTVILFSIGIMRHPAFGKIFGGIGVVFGIVGLGAEHRYLSNPADQCRTARHRSLCRDLGMSSFALLIRAHRKTRQTAPVSVAMPPAS